MKIHWVVETNLVGNAYGYANMQKQLRKALEANGHEIGMGSGVAVHATTPDAYRPLPGYYNVLLTMYECTTIPDDWVAPLAEADLLIVPCTHNQRLFSQYTKTPIEVVPLGVHRSVYPFHQRTRPIDRPFVYLWVGASNPRKGYEHVIVAWKMFQEDYPDLRGKVQLIMKTTQYSEIPRHTEYVMAGDGTVIMNKSTKQLMPAERLVHVGGNAVVDTRRLPMRAEGDLPGLVDLYDFAHCFVFPTMGEGFGLTLAEAMSTGLPCVYTPYSGPVDFISDREGYPVKWHYKEIQTMQIEPDGSRTEKHHSFGASADIKSVVRKMYRVYTHYDQALEKGKLASDRISAYTWERSADKLVAAILKHNREAA